MAKIQDQDIEINKKIGQKLLELRLARGLSREKVAEKLNVTGQQLHKYERGANRISVSKMVGLSEILEVKPMYFLADFNTEEEEDMSDIYRIRMHLEIIRHLEKVDHELQNTILNLIKAIAKDFNHE